MRPPGRRWRPLVLGLLVLAGLPPLAWLGLSYKPGVYRRVMKAEALPEQRQARARRFVSQSLQLRNDIVNEPLWEARFSDDEVNAWVVEDLLTTFADQVPSEVHDPRVLFEDDKATIVFEMKRGLIRSVITVVCRARVPEDNVLAVTLEKIHAGILPLPAEQLTEPITQHAKAHGLEVTWGKDGRAPVAYLRYTTDPERTDVVLEKVQFLDGELRMAGRSNRKVGRIASPTLPNRGLLQSRFPRRARQPSPVSRQLPPMPDPSSRSRIGPFSFSPAKTTTTSLWPHEITENCPRSTRRTDPRSPEMGPS